MAGAARFDLSGQTLTRDEERAIAARLRAGDLVIYPTDTLYAIGCLALEGRAVGRLREAKGRDGRKPLPVIVADLDQARSLSSHWPAEAQRLAEAFWPGPLTVVVPAASGVPSDLLAGAPGVAVRVPDSEDARKIARIAGPLVSTSANLAGEPPCLTVDQALAAFPEAGLVFDGGRLEGEPSTLVDVTAAPARVLREGRIAADRVREALGGEASRASPV